MSEICAICGDEHDKTSFELKCGHMFHKSCIKMSVEMSTSNIRECPYCRKRFKQGIDALKRNYDEANRPKCNVILKSGKRKGQSCGNKTSYNINNEYVCGTHYKSIIKKNCDNNNITTNCCTSE